LAGIVPPFLTYIGDVHPIMGDESLSISAVSDSTAFTKTLGTFSSLQVETEGAAPSVLTWSSSLVSQKVKG
jgi:hypothetical protein